MRLLCKCPISCLMNVMSFWWMYLSRSRSSSVSTLVKRKVYCFTKFWRRCKDPQPYCIIFSCYFKLTVLNLPRKRSLAKGTFVKGFLISSRNSGSVCGFTSATSVAKQRSPCAWIAFLWLLPTNWFFVNRKICLCTENDIVKIVLLYVPGLSGQLCER